MRRDDVRPQRSARPVAAAQWFDDISLADRLRLGYCHLERVAALQSGHMPVSQHGPVLIIDDNADTRESLIALLEAKGNTVAVAESADDALRLLREGLAPC